MVRGRGGPLILFFVFLLVIELLLRLDDRRPRPQRPGNHAAGLLDY